MKLWKPSKVKVDFLFYPKIFNSDLWKLKLWKPSKVKVVSLFYPWILLYILLYFMHLEHLISCSWRQAQRPSSPSKPFQPSSFLSSCSQECRRHDGKSDDDQQHRQEHDRRKWQGERERLQLDSEDLKGISYLRVLQIGLNQLFPHFSFFSKSVSLGTGNRPNFKSRLVFLSLLIR